MNLTDKDILELNELCNAVVDETITEKQKAELARFLKESEEARQFYIRLMGQSASLCSYAAELQTEAPEGTCGPVRIGGGGRHWVFGLLSAAAAIVIVSLVLWTARPRPKSPLAAADPSPAATTDPAVNENEFVARLTGSKDCAWAGGAGGGAPLGGRLRKGQILDLEKGYAEVTFDCGAQVILQGPASLDVKSAWSATLTRGTLRASLPPEAMGFSISNPTVEVVDLGTEFTMFADASGATTDVLVLKGEVEAAPKTQATDQQPIVLREKEGRRFATSGISNVHHDEQKFGALTEPVELDRFVPPAGYAHWSFDEADGDVLKVIDSDLAFNAADAEIFHLPPAAASIHTKGRYQHGLRFDGRMYARAAFPGISENTPHSVMFWVKVPRDANLSSAYAMAAWGVNNKQLGSHPIHIGWNRHPNDGPVGVLRTDYGGGFARGSVPLRDGRWHHIAVVFIPRGDTANPVEVKQYVDGRLDGEGKPSPRGSDIFEYSNEEPSPTANSTLWLGCRLGKKEVRADRFIGEMDELFIADRALEPREIVRLMTLNHP